MESGTLVAQSSMLAHSRECDLRALLIWRHEKRHYYTTIFFSIVKVRVDRLFGVWHGSTSLVKPAFWLQLHEQLQQRTWSCFSELFGKTSLHVELFKTCSHRILCRTHQRKLELGEATIFRSMSHPSLERTSRGRP